MFKFFYYFIIFIFSLAILKANDDVMLDPNTAVCLGTENDLATVLDTDITFTEGPVWRKSTGEVFFSEIPKNAIYRWTEKDGKTLFMRPAGFTKSDSEIRKFLALGPNGLALTKDNKIIICQQGNARLAVLDEKTFSVKVLADNFEGKLFNSINDLTVSKSGEIFFTDPCFWNKRRGYENNELGFSGIYKLDPDGNIVLIDKLPRPNGIALSMDEKFLYVSQSNGDDCDPGWYVYELSEDKNSFKSKRMFCNQRLWREAKIKGTPDGFKVDPKTGYIYASGSGGVHIFEPNLKHIGYVKFELPISNLCIIDDENGNTKSLFLTGLKKNYLLDIMRALKQ